MSPARTLEVARLEFLHGLRRPLFWVQLLILGFLSWELAGGHAQLGSGDARVGGTKAWITSEFAVTQMLIILASVLYVFFASVAAGMALIRDEELQVTDVLHATRLTPGEYVWGKSLGVLTSLMGVLMLHLALTILFNHGVPHGENADYIGPFVLGNYLRPALVFAVPTLVLFVGVCLAIGTLTRQPVLVFSFPIAQVLVGAFFLWEWSPAWLAPGVNRLLQVVDLSGLRWIKETYLNVDRGVDFYNHAHVTLDGMMVAQRLVCVALGLGAVALTQARVAMRLRGARARVRGAQPEPTDGVLATPLEPKPLAAFAMRSAKPGFWSGTLEVARIELRLLGRHPGLYLFVPMILIQLFGGVIETGAFDTPLLQTPGTLAVAAMNTLTLLICMVILFYTTESLQRERSTRLGAITYGSPLPTGALLLGKSIANTLLGAGIVTAGLAGCAIVLAVQGKVAFDVVPFAVVWGLLLMPTFLFWSSFVGATYAVTGNRFATYAVGLGAMSLTGWFQLRGKMNWVANWDLWSATRWSDVSGFQLDALPLTLNRVEVLGVATALIALMVGAFVRRERDATRNVERLQPARLGRYALAAAPWLVVPVVAAVALALQVDAGWQGRAERKLARDYWKKNALTWRDAALPSIAFADLDVRLEPKRRWIASRGAFDLMNRTDQPLAAIPVTAGFQWRKLEWSLNGRPVKPENRAGLWVIRPEQPLAPGERLRLGWSYETTAPHGISKNGAGVNEFVLPSSVVLTGFDGADLCPHLGYEPDVGVEEDKNQADPREYPDDYYKGETPAGMAMAESWFDTRIRVSIPAGYQVNATGVCVKAETNDGRSLTEWRSDHPVRIFNLVAGHWKEKRGDGAVVYYDPHHPYNVDEMLEALEGARRWYGAWFAPYPWRDLRLTEFAAMDRYAQGSPGNITFSEGIGFLTRSKPEANAAFWITAHEAAHQWWPNLAMSGRGPGGDVLSEGMAHFSTILLTEQVKGLEQRMAFCKEIEDRYANTRRRDSERPLVKVNGELPADQRIIYDKGGWAFWMLFQLMGRDAGLAAQRDYLATYRDSRDHPLLQDYLAIMRKHAPDTTGFDACAKQWFYEVVVPQYLVRDAEKTRTADGWETRARIKNVGTGTMRVEIAATRGERFPRGSGKHEPYQDARGVLTLAAGEEGTVAIRGAFEPQKLVVDPDVRVLQLERQKAAVELRERRVGKTLAGQPTSLAELRN